MCWQFFISSTANSSGDTDGDGRLGCSERCALWYTAHLSTELIENEIANAIATRIERAIKHDETLRVVIMLPNYPEGALTDISVQVVFHYELLTLMGIPGMLGTMDGNEHGSLRHFGSLVNRVQEACVLRQPADPNAKDRWTEYLTVGCLRSYDIIEQKPFVEQIYIHAKLLIVDDRTVICGSANINDRSMLGTRDSEVCVKISGQDSDGTMDGHSFQVVSSTVSQIESIA